VRRVFGHWENRNEYIPAIGVTPVEHPDTYDMQQAPTSLNAPKGSTTVNLDRARKTIVIKCYEQGVNPELIRRSVLLAAKEHGTDAIAAIEVMVSDATMASADGVWLIANGYERQLDANVKSGLYRFRKVIKWKKKEEEK
jgi:hypothetical protein